MRVASLKTNGTDLIDAQEIIRHEINTEFGEWHHLTLVSDAHIESTNHAEKRFQKMLSTRAQIENHHFAAFGDMLSLVLPGDKRYEAGFINPDAINSKSAIADAILDYGYQRVKHVKWDMWGQGNHGTKSTKQSHTNIDRRIATRLGCQLGGYTGFLAYQMRTHGGKFSLPFVVLYSHGSWCGGATHGWAPFTRWATMKQGWHVAAAGHNHKLDVHSETLTLMPRGASLVPEKRIVKLVYTGCYEDNTKRHPQASSNHEEISGNLPSVIGSPLLNWRVVRVGNNADIEMNITV